MMVDQGVLKSIQIDKLELDLENPRHGKVKTPEAAITYLLEKETVVSLALDIAEKGLNPMDLLGVTKRKGCEVYVSVEGNRRVCSLMLLHDPEKVPNGFPNRTKIIAKLERAVSQRPLPRTINCIVFGSKKSAMPWIATMHLPESTARRRRWNPDQQAYAMGGGRNYDALQILDVAVSLQMISRDEREATLTTVQRYIGNPLMRINLGLERAKDRSLAIRLQRDEFMKLFTAFIDDVKSGKLSSRSKKDDVEKYAKELLARVPCDQTIVRPSPLKGYKPATPEAPEEVGDGETSLPVLPRPPLRACIGRKSDLEKVLFEINSQKLTSLYMSCVELPLKSHAPLITVGVWSIMETLAALHNGSEAKFVQYFNNDRIANVFGMAEKSKLKSIRAAIDDIANRGNSTKHSAEAAFFDGAQLANHFDILTPLITAVCANIPK